VSIKVTIEPIVDNGTKKYRKLYYWNSKINKNVFIC